MEIIYLLVQYCLDMFGGVIPEGDLPVFVTTLSLAGWMVAVDACLFLIAVLPLLSEHKAKWFPLIFLITITHAVAGYLGLAILAAGMTTGVALWMMLGLTSWGGLRFIVDGMDDDEDDPGSHAKKILIGLLTAAVLILCWGVSYDEFFAVWQRFQWMVAQGWNTTAMAVNIGLSMVVLLAVQCGVAITLLVFKPLTDWFHKRGDTMMFIVFGLLMYYLARGVLQNGLGYNPWEIPYTGIAPDLMILGFILTFLLKLALEKSESFENGMKFILLIKDDEDEGDEEQATV